MNISDRCKKPLILAVDDNLDNLLLLEYQLPEVIDCLLVTATDGETALLLVESKSPDLVLMDVLLPNMDGTEVIRRMKQAPQTADIPVIAMTAFAKDDDRAHILQSGCDDYLSKPYDLEDLQTVILRHLVDRS